MFMLIYEQYNLDVELQEINTITGEVSYSGIDNPIVVHPGNSSSHKYLFPTLESAVEVKELLESSYPEIVYKIFKVEEVQ